MRLNEREARKPGSGRPAREFDRATIARMFAAREDGVSDTDIARRFGITDGKLRTLIGRRTP